MLVGVYLDARLASSTSKSAESKNNEAFVVVHCCWHQIFQHQILTNKHGKIAITTSFCSAFQFLLAALQKNAFGSVLLGIEQMLVYAIILTLDWAELLKALIFCFM